jgi:phosphatidylglycerophosphate synthase
MVIYKSMGLTPNRITALGFVLSLVSAYLVSQYLLIPALAVWWLGRLLDGTDGIYARQTNQQTAFGAHLDILCDMASYSVMMLGFFVAFPNLHLNWIIILLLYVLCITGALSLGSFEEKNKMPSSDNRGLRLAAGIAEGGETGIAYTLFLLFPKYLNILTTIWIVVLMATIVARLILAKRELK